MLARMYSPFAPLFANEPAGLLKDFFQGMPSGAYDRPFPALNVWEDEQGYHVEAELPGLKLEDLELTVSGNELTLKGQRKEPQAGQAYHRRERGTGSFSRILRFPVDLDAEKAQAVLEQGILTLHLPRHEAARLRCIEVKVAGQ